MLVMFNAPLLVLYWMQLVPSAIRWAACLVSLTLKHPRRGSSSIRSMACHCCAAMLGTKRGGVDAMLCKH